MMLSTIFIIKFIIFTQITNVEYNRIPLVIISTLIAMFILSLINKFSKKSYPALIAYSLISILMLVDATYYKQFSLFTSIEIINQLGQLKTVGESIRVLMDIKVIALIIDIPFLFFAYPRNRKKEKEGKLDKKRYKNLFGKHPVIIGIALLIVLTYYNTKEQMESIKTQEFFIYHIIDIKDNLIEGNKSQTAEFFSDKDINELKERANLKEGNFTGIGRGKNLIVLQVEALQNFVIDYKYKGQEITPNINKLIKDQSTIYYDNYFQIVGKGNTSDAEFASLNSLYPSTSSATYLEYGDNTYYGLPMLLKVQGYTAWAFHGYDKDYWNRNNIYDNFGFERFINEEDFEYYGTIGFGLRDQDFYSQSLEYIKELDKKDDNPYFAFLISLSSHTPFNMEEEYKALELGKELDDSMTGNYLQAIHYTDKQIGLFMEGLKREGLYEDSVIALYGDHFALQVSDEKERTIMTDLLGKPYDYDEMMKVPLLIHVPSYEINKKVSIISSQIDFYPTIANIMGYNIVDGLIFGKDINNFKGESYVFPQMYIPAGSVITKDSIFEMSRDGVFEHSSARSIGTSNELELEPFRDLYKKAIKEIKMSNYILRKDLLKNLN
ncbi:LTA synthase family protein [Tissierella creatinini]|nr:LTA synthase family protein [Tissierella creatinini]TJX61084.1 LTA synthase family protein [Soehngenia saccharolytica]